MSIALLAFVGFVLFIPQRRRITDAAREATIGTADVIVFV
jgi:hypothetical protein